VKAARDVDSHRRERLAIDAIDELAGDAFDGPRQAGTEQCVDDQRTTIEQVERWVAGLATALLAAALYLAFFVAPPDYQQGETVRIMFLHVPAAWLGLMAYLVIAASSFGLLVFRHPLADVSAKAAAPIGAAFTLIALLTGSLWGKPMWGTYWVWDARLTSVLLLFFLYLGLIALRSSIEEETLAAKLTAVLALVGVVLLPIIKFSVEWWNTLHQPSTGFTSSVHASIRTPLLVSAAGFTLLFVALHLKAMRNEVLRRRVKALQLAAVERAARGAAAAEETA
jgi:heme exporter protein C